VNLPNKGTLWTPLHSASFQGHGKVIMKLMDYNPDVTLTDNQGRYKTSITYNIKAALSFPII